MNITYFYGKLPQNFNDCNFPIQNFTKKITSCYGNFLTISPGLNFTVILHL